jgi:hypothetical protein
MNTKAVVGHPYVEHLPAVEDESVDATGSTNRGQARLDWRQALGAVSVVAGLVTLFAGWFGMSGTTQLSAQLAYMFSGGFGGAALIALGATMFVAFEHHADRMAIQALDRKLTELQARTEGSAPHPAGATGSGQHAPSD